MKKLGIVITDGVGYRNFMLSQFIVKAAKEFEEILIYSGIPIEAYKTLQLPKNVVIHGLPVFKEKKITWVFRKLKELAHVYKFRQFYGFNDNWKIGFPKGSKPGALLLRFLYAVATVFHSENCIQFFEKLQFFTFKSGSTYTLYKKLLKHDKLNLLFFTHQRPPFVAPILAAAQALNIKTVTFIFSWDNLASKGRMMGSFNHYLVWSNLMKDELKYFYPKTNDNATHIVGTPQFEPYVMDEYTVERHVFCKKMGLDPQKRIICYSCADVSIGKNDAAHIVAIQRFIDSNKALNLQLLVRTSPAEDDSRFKELQNKFQNIKWNVPKWKLTREGHIENWSQRVPTKEDINDLKSILSFADVNVNMCSTMSLDFMLFDKPVINTVFGNETNGLYNDQRFLQFDHYKKVVESGAVTIAKIETELFLALNEALNNPEKQATARKSLLALQISKPLEGTSKRIVQTLKKLTLET